MADFGRRHSTKRHGKQKTNGAKAKGREGRSAWRDDCRVYCRFLETLYYRQVEGDDWLVYTIDMATPHFAAALLESEGFRQAMSSSETPSGRFFWNGDEYFWSIRRFDRTEDSGWNAHGYPEDFVLRLFVEAAEGKDHDAPAAERGRDWWGLSPVQPLA